MQQQKQDHQSHHLHHPHQPHLVSYKTLLSILASLLALTFVTVGVSRLHLGQWGVWVALFIASCKATLVLSVFMHLKYESKALRGMFYITVFFLAILIGFVFFDVGFRV